MARKKTVVEDAPIVDPYLLEAEAARRQEGGNFVFFHPGLGRNCIAIGDGVFEPCGLPDGYAYNLAKWSGYGACPLCPIAELEPLPEDEALNFDDAE